LTLQPCGGLWGAATIIDSDPVHEVVRDAIYQPLHPSIFLDSYHGWGIYHRDGRLVQACAYYRLPDQALIGQCQHMTPPLDPEPAPPGTFVYGGPVIMHYGHFMTAALPRLWQAVRRGLPPDAKIVCHSHEAPEEWFKRDYVRTILGRLGLAPSRFVRFGVPTLIPLLHAPRPAMEEQNFAHRVFRDLCLHIGRPYQAPPSGRTIWLSKTRMANGIYRLLNEDAMQDAMQAAGIEVIHPETLSFAAQAGLMSGSAVVAGTVGSGFHTAVFCGRAPRVVALAYGPVLNANYALMDGLTGCRAEYFYSPDMVAAEGAGAATFCYRAADPAGLARALIERIHSGPFSR